MENYNKKYDNAGEPRRPDSSRVWVGTLLFVAGLGLFGYKMGLPLPGWLFTWPMVLILVGVAIGAKDRFQNPGSWILLLIGFIFLADENIPGFNFQRFIAPMILVMIGLIFIFRPKNRIRSKSPFHKDFPPTGDPAQQRDELPSSGDFQNRMASDEEYLNINSVFGGIKKNVVSKNFKGGNIITFMGGADINLAQADIRGPIILEVNNIFGGTKMIIPANWHIKNEISAIFGGVEDKRNPSALSPDPDKTLILKGTCLFGGVEFVSY